MTNDLRVGVRNGRTKSYKMWKKILENTDFDFFVILNSSHGFLSMIFGLLSKFRVGVVKNIFKNIIFRNGKKSREMIEKIFFETKKFSEKIYEKVNGNQKFQNSDFFERGAV